MISRTTTHSLQLDSGDAEQVSNPWTSPSTATNCQQGDTDSVFRDDAIVWRNRDMILSPSPPPQPAQPIHAQPPMQGTDTDPTDPQIASLKSIFPDFDDTVMFVDPTLFVSVLDCSAF